LVEPRSGKNEGRVQLFSSGEEEEEDDDDEVEHDEDDEDDEEDQVEGEGPTAEEWGNFVQRLYTSASLSSSATPTRDGAVSGRIAEAISVAFAQDAYESADGGSACTLPHTCTHTGNIAYSLPPPLPTWSHSHLASSPFSHDLDYSRLLPPLLPLLSRDDERAQLKYSVGARGTLSDTRVTLMACSSTSPRYPVEAR